MQLTAPATGSSYLTGQTIPLTATAADADGIAKVSFYYGTTLIGEQAGNPYSINWNTSGLAGGSYSLTARLLDNLGNVTTSAAITVQLSVPAANRVTFYRAINLNGNQVVLDNYQWLGAGPGNYTTNGGAFTNTTVALSPATDEVRTAMIRSSVWRNTGLELNIPIPQVDNGTYQVYLYVWEDNNPETFSILLEGQVVESNYNSGPAGTWKKLGPYQASIIDNSVDLSTTGGTANFSGVELWRVPAGNQAGTVTLTSPTPNQFITTGPTFSLTATASDDDGVARVEFYYGTNKIGEDATTPYSLNWNTAGLPGGPGQISARVVDNAGGVTTSAPALVQLVDGTVSWLFSRGINLNGGAVTIGNNLWEGSSATNTTVVAGTPFTNTTALLTPQPDAATAGMLESGVGHGSNLQLNFGPITNGTYVVYLYAFSGGDPATFSLGLEGETVLRNYTTGAAGWWAKLGPFQVTVNDQAINLAHSGGTLMLSGVEVLQPTGPANQPPTLGLQAYWPFNSAGTMGSDASGKGYTGTLHNTPTWVAGGRVGGSMEMADNAGRHMSVPGLNWQPTKFTVAWWLYPESYNSYNQQLVAARGWGGFVFHTTPNGSVHVGTDLATRMAPTSTQLSAGTVRLNQWQHFTFTFDNGTGKFYKNGQLLVTKTGMALPLAWGGFTVGNSTPEGAIHGLVDEVRIYDRALQDAEVSRTANFYPATLTCTWKPDAGSTTWNSAANWVEGNVPTSNDNVIVNTCSNCPVLPGSLRINALTLNAAARLDLQAHTLTTLSAYMHLAKINSTGGRIKAGRFSQIAVNIFDGPVTLEKTGPGVDAAHGGNTFNGTTVFDYNVNPPEYSPAYLGYSQGDVFYGDVTANSISGTFLKLATSYYGGRPSTFHKKLAGIAAGSSVMFGEVISTKTGSVELTSYGRNVDFQKGQVSGPATINLRYAAFAGGTGMYIGGVNFDGPVVVNNTNTSRVNWGFYGIRFGNSQSGINCIFSPTASLTVGGEGFYGGDLVLERCTFGTSLEAKLDLTVGPTSPVRTGRVIIGAGTYFTGPVAVRAPRIQLNGGTFGSEANFIKTGVGTDNSIGGNTFRRKATFTNQAGADSPFNLATQQDDLVQQ